MKRVYVGKRCKGGGWWDQIPSLTERVCRRRVTVRTGTTGRRSDGRDNFTRSPRTLFRSKEYDREFRAGYNGPGRSVVGKGRSG